MADIKIPFFEKYDEDGLKFVRMTVAPYLFAQVIQIKDQQKADEYKQKLQYRYFAQVTGYNIFVKHSGFYIKPQRQITAREIKFVVDQMCDWYLENVANDSSQFTKRFKIKTNE